MDNLLAETRHDRSPKPVIKDVTYFLGHVPNMIQHASKPSREISKKPDLLEPITNSLQSFDEAVGYPPNQVFIGNLTPDDLRSIQSPWYQNRTLNASRWGAFGEIMPEEEFLGMMKICDEFDLISFGEKFTDEISLRLKSHPLLHSADIKKLGCGDAIEFIENKVKNTWAMPLYVHGDNLVGCLQRGHAEDPNLTPEILVENLAARASGVMALRRLLDIHKNKSDIDYLLGCGEEAVGDRYNRGGGNLAKAIGELCDCSRATGSDVKAFCCAPIHAIIMAAALVTAKIFKNVTVVAGGSFAKLGMKFQGHLRNNMPILEDVLAGTAILVGQDDGKSPVIRLDSIGKHEISSGSAQQAILTKLVTEPLDQLGLKLTDITKFATEMHNPELTQPQGSGDVPQTNYRTIGSLAVLREEITRDDLDHFVDTHGMPGFSPTQGHIASAIPVLGHSLKEILEGRMENTMFLAKGSLFLGRMTQLADGISFLLEKNKGDSSD
jgi:betaine reductase